jgi:hypothetical protein
MRAAAPGRSALCPRPLRHRHGASLAALGDQQVTVAQQAEDLRGTL